MINSREFAEFKKHIGDLDLGSGFYAFGLAPSDDGSIPVHKVYFLASWLLSNASAFSNASDAKMLEALEEYVDKAKKLAIEIRNEAFPDINGEHSWRKGN